MQTHKFLAVDIGASGGRILTGDFKDGLISLKEISRFYNGMTLVHGRYYWDIYRIFEDIKKGMKEAVDQGEKPVSLGIDTWAVDYGLLDETGHLLGLPYAYRDHRTDSVMDEFFRIMPREELYHLTGIQFLQFNTVFQLYAAMKDKSPVVKIAKDLLFIPDLLHYFLSGVKKSEFTFATTSQLYNPRSKAWAPEIFEKIGVRMDLMQEIVTPGTIIGKLTEEIMKETGAQGMDIAAVASHDTGSAIASIPAEEEHFAYISSGTWSLMGIESNVPVITSQSMEFNFTNEGGVDGTFRVLKNIMGLWLIQECKKVWFQSGVDYGYPALVRMAASSTPFRTLIDPNHPSLLNPENMLEALYTLVRKSGEPDMKDPGEFTRCIFESLAFRYRQTLEELKQISDKEIRKIHIIGGGSQNELLCQFTANATGLPVISGPAEGASLGNIMVQAMAKGVIKTLKEARQVIRHSFEFKTYIPEDVSKWDAQYSRYLDVCSRTAKRG